MNITLISTDECISSHGIRGISSYLKGNGHSVRLIFLPMELADRLQNKDYYYDIRNLWFKRDGQIIKNPDRPRMRVFT